MNMFQTTFDKEGTVLTVQPGGSLDSAAAPEFSGQLEQELDGISTIVMDLERVDYIASAGLRVFLKSEQEMEERGGGMKLIHVNENVLEVLQLTGFLDFVTLE